MDNFGHWCHGELLDVLTFRSAKAQAEKVVILGHRPLALGEHSWLVVRIGREGLSLLGWNSGVNNLTGSTNTIIGAQALSNNVNGSGNIAIGHYAGYYSTGSNGF